MSYLELYPIVASAVVWGGEWTGKTISVFSDNEGTVAILRKGRSHCPEINKLMRRLVLLQTVHNFILQSVWISTKVNIHADLLSRGSLSQFQALAPSAIQVPSPPLPAVTFTKLLCPTVPTL